MKQESYLKKKTKCFWITSHESYMIAHLKNLLFAPIGIF